MDKITQRKLKMLVETKEWEVIYTFVDKIVEKWNAVPVKGETEWETLWNVAEKQGKIDGLKEAINSLEELAHETNV
jgi:hypothetical protein